MARRKWNPVEFVYVENARALVTIAPDYNIWSFPGTVTPPEWKGAFVRLQPPAKATDEDIERVKKELLVNGVAAIRVLPRAAKQAVLTPSKAVPKPHQTARQVVSDLLAEAQSSDPAALRAVVEETMAKVGL